MASQLSQMIKRKVRRLTATGNQNQLTNAELNQYIDTFVQFDFPSALKIWNLNDTYTFFTQAYEDQYTIDVKDVHAITQPVYCDGYQMLFLQSRTQFFGLYPEIGWQQQGDVGTGLAGPYEFTLQNTPFVKRQVTIYAIDSAGATQTAYDVPDPTQNDVGDLVDSVDPTQVVGSVNYVTGEVEITFLNTIPSDEVIYAKTSGYQPSRPATFLFFDNKVTLRPIPDTVYRINFQIYRKPSEILDADDADNDPNLTQWWQYIALGAALRISQDKQDMESVANITPMLKEQEALILYRTATQNAQARTSTIYSTQWQQPFGQFGYGGMA